jgi:CheY-like chemotaxis protein
MTITGTGMGATVAARMLEPFFSTRANGRVRGLGMTVVEGFVHRTGGELRIETAPGSGTTVTMVFPRAPEAPSAAQSDAASEPEEVRASAGAHVLLVEDEPAVRTQLAAHLQALGHRVSRASDGPEALALLQADPTIALLFTDVLMPGGMHGGGLARQARTVRPELPVLFTSGFSADALAEEGRLRGEVLLHAKPFRRADLERMLARALDRAGGD